MGKVYALCSLLPGFTVAIHHGNTSEVLHKVDQDVLLKLDSSHVDRQSRKWYAVKTPLKAHSGGLSRLTAVLYYDNGPMEGETRQVTFVKAPPTDSRVVHVDHKYASVCCLTCHLSTTCCHMTVV